MTKQISGGFYIKARKIKESVIAHAAPCTREVWDYLLREANHKDNKALGIKRGQLLRTISEIQHELHWMIGYCKKTYSKSQCEAAYDFLRKNNMITTLKTTRGMIITICNYDYYNSPENYEANNNPTTSQQVTNKQRSTINKNVENEENVENVVVSNNPFFEFFRRAAGSHISDTELLQEIGKFQNKYPNAHPNQSGALINTWVANIGKTSIPELQKPKVYV